jgi:hypothetical protein
MTVEDTAFNDDEEALLALLPEDGTALGNISLRRSLHGLRRVMT